MHDLTLQFIFLNYFEAYKENWQKFYDFISRYKNGYYLYRILKILDCSDYDLYFWMDGVNPSKSLATKKETSKFLELARELNQEYFDGTVDWNWAK